MNQEERISFLAMEYYLLMLNRSFEITITPLMICGAFVQGIISATAPSVGAARLSNDATELVNSRRLSDCRAQQAGSRAYLALHRFNFTIPHSNVALVRFNPKSKWGMGPVPHSGRIHVEVRDGTSRELILLGKQDGHALLHTVRGFGYPIGAA